MPPAIVKQTPPPTPSAKAPSIGGGGVLDSAIDVSELRETWIKVCLYGRNRIGKTTLACQFPKPLLLLAMEPTETGGAMSVVSTPGVKVIRISYKPLIDPRTKKPEKLYGTRKALTLAEELQRNNPFATVVIDTATAFQDIILTELMGLSAVPEMLSWGLVPEDMYRARSEKTRECLRPFLGLACNVVVVAQEKDHNPPTDRSKSKLTRTMQQDSFMAADLGGATVKWLHDACGYIGQLYQDAETKVIVNMTKVGSETRVEEVEVPTGRIVRRLRTLYHPNFAAGFRSASPEAVPEYIEATSPKEMYEEMMKVVAGVKSSKGKY